MGPLKPQHIDSWIHFPPPQNGPLHTLENVQSLFMLSSHSAACSYMHWIHPACLLEMSFGFSPYLSPRAPTWPRSMSFHIRAIHSSSSEMGWWPLELDSKPQLRFGTWPCLLNSIITFILRIMSL